MAIGIIGSVESLAAYFVDVTKEIIEAKIGSIDVELLDLRLKSGSTEEIDENNELVEVDDFNLNDVANLRFQIKNTGLSASMVDVVIKMYWDNEIDISEKNIVYLFPGSMTDASIRNNIINSNGSQAIAQDEVSLITNNNEARIGFVYEVPTFYLDSEISNACKIDLSGGNYLKDFTFKIAMVSNNSQTIEDFIIYGGND